MIGQEFCEPWLRWSAARTVNEAGHLFFQGSRVGFNVDLNVNVVARRGGDAEFHGIVAGHIEIAALGCRGGMERGAERLSWFYIRKQALESESHGDDFADASNRERAVHSPGPAFGGTANALAVVGHSGEFGDFEEVGAAEIIVAFGELGAEAKSLDGDVQRADGGISGDGDGAGGLVEAPPDRADDVMPGAEVNEGVDRVDLVGARRGELGGGGRGGLGPWGDARGLRRRGCRGKRPAETNEQQSRYYMGESHWKMPTAVVRCVHVASSLRFGFAMRMENTLSGMEKS